MIVVAFVLQMLRIATPYLFAAAGGVVSERAGVIALTLEGFMLGGAFGAALGSHATGSPWIGALCGALGGTLFAAVHAIAVVRYRANQVVVGVAINLLVVGLTRFFLRFLFDSSSNSPRVEGFDAGRGGIAGGLLNPLVFLGLVTLPLVAFLIYRTKFGLRVRAVGEHPEAAESVGIHVSRVRIPAVLLSGALAGLGGAYLALEQHQFTDGMSAGRGFIALAAVIFGRWEPMRVALACLLFAGAETLQIQLQGSQALPSQLVESIPYVLTIIALATVVGRSVSPAALGRTEEA